MSYKKNAELFLVSLIMLFAEVALIRWVSTESRIFAYVNNLVLLSCFLGIGIGCYYSHRRMRLSFSLLALLILVLLIDLPFQLNIGNQSLHPFRDIPLMLSGFADSLIWGEPNITSPYLMTILGMSATLILFFVILFIFIPLGQIFGRLLNESDHLIATYSINVGASILGIWCFAYLSFLYAAPIIWFALIIAGILLLHFFQSGNSRFERYSLPVASIFLILILIFPLKTDKALKTIWSPYQKLQLYELMDEKADINRGFYLDVNGIVYMSLLDLSNEFIDKHPDYYSRELRNLSHYDIPYLFKDSATNVLILGCGAGNDVAGALRHGINCIDAVEIDPGIYELGRDYHPEKPYSNPKVNIIIDDARSFFKKSNRKYDVISFGLLDAHTLSSSHNNTRIDNYVYTEESLREARERLKEDGILTLIFEAKFPWMEKRIYGLLWKVFGGEPLAFQTKLSHNYGWGGIMYVASLNPNTLSKIVDSEPVLKAYLANRQFSYPESEFQNGGIRLTTDDWPYFYIEKAGIPGMHLCLMILLGILFLGARKIILTAGHKLDYHFFFLGAAFLLLEFQNISKSSLLFGSTWLANGFIISAILLLILMANLFVVRFGSVNSRLIYILLISSLVLALIIPLDFFNAFEYWKKSILASLMLNLPVFFAGVIFITSLKRIGNRSVAFGSNLLGAAAGGIMESISYIIGIKLVLLVVTIFYLFSWYYERRG